MQLTGPEGTIKFWSTETKHSMTNFTEYVRARIPRSDAADVRELPKPSGNAASGNTAAFSIADELRKLANLQADGILSADECALLKQKLLAR